MDGVVDGIVTHASAKYTTSLHEGQTSFTGLVNLPAPPLPVIDILVPPSGDCAIIPFCPGL
jgi:hypothetical protein